MCDVLWIIGLNQEIFLVEELRNKIIVVSAKTTTRFTSDCRTYFSDRNPEGLLISGLYVGLSLLKISRGRTEIRGSWKSWIRRRYLRERDLQQRSRIMNSRKCYSQDCKHLPSEERRNISGVVQNLVKFTIETYKGF